MPPRSGTSLDELNAARKQRSSIIKKRVKKREKTKKYYTKDKKEKEEKKKKKKRWERKNQNPTITKKTENPKTGIPYLTAEGLVNSGQANTLNKGLGDAILDRILAKCFNFDLKGKSLRIN